MLKYIKKFLTFLILGIGISLFSNHPAQAQNLFIRGDINCDGVVDTVDLRLMCCPVPGVHCLDRLDVNDNGNFAYPTDSIYLANYLFFGGPPPPYPFPDCGLDTTGGEGCGTSCCCTLTTECNDGIDNDADGLVDFPADISCTNACDSLEEFLVQCKDGIDNDGDSLSDYPDDCGCESENDTSETPNPVTQCNDGIDNDEDGLIDFPCDRGCRDACDMSEAPFSTTPQCTDGIDNDGDGLVDLADTNCVDSCDFSEFFVCYYKPGDFNGNGFITLTDIIGLVGYVFKSGPSPSPKCRGDANGNGSVTLTDIIFLVNFVFKNGVDPIPSGVCCNPT